MTDSFRFLVIGFMPTTTESVYIARKQKNRLAANAAKRFHSRPWILISSQNLRFPFRVFIREAVPFNEYWPSNISNPLRSPGMESVNGILGNT